MNCRGQRTTLTSDFASEPRRDVTLIRGLILVSHSPFSRKLLQTGVSATQQSHWVQHEGSERWATVQNQ